MMPFWFSQPVQYTVSVLIGYFRGCLGFIYCKIQELKRYSVLSDAYGLKILGGTVQKPETALRHIMRENELVSDPVTLHVGSQQKV